MVGRSGARSARDCTFDKNYTESSGGALYIYKGTQTLDQCHFLNNSAAWGGGIYNIVGNLSITRCVFTGNHADYEGGGLYDDAPRPVCVASTLFAGNRALSMGGGLYCWCDSDPNVVNCTFADNRAPRGSAVAAGLPVLKNCICWDQQTEGSPIHQLGDGPMISYSCIQGGWTYRIEGSFGLTVDMETGMAEFVDVEATATDVDNPDRTVDFETGLVLTALVGTIQDDGSIAFTGTATDGRALFPLGHDESVSA